MRTFLYWKLHSQYNFGRYINSKTNNITLIHPRCHTWAAVIQLCISEEESGPKLIISF